MLGKVFGKRIRPQTAQTDGTPPARTGALEPSAGALKTVIVRKSAVEAARNGTGNPHLVQEVVNFVNAMIRDGMYRRNEVDPKSIQAYHADFYLAQVNNGGHSQFVHNCFANLRTCIDDACQGLAAMGAHAHLATLEDLRSWVERNPDAAKQQTGFDGGRAPELEPLDKRFFAAEKASAMVGYSARWILSWPELRPVEDADYPEALRRTAMLNPMREQRLLAASIASFGRQMTDWFPVATGLVCAQMNPMEFRLGVGPGQHMDVEGQNQLAFMVQTNSKNRRFCAVTEQSAAVYDCIEADNPPMPEMGDEKGMLEAIRDGRLARFRGPRVGPRLAHVEAKSIAGIIALAKDYDAPAALDLLLRRARLDPTRAIVAAVMVEPKSSGAVGHWMVFVEGRPFNAVIASHRGVLLTMDDHAQLAIAETREIEDHGQRARSDLAR